MMVLNFLVLLIFILLSVAFFTLFEVKTLGSFHLRPGPDKASFIGLFQPIADFLKLFFKMDFFLLFYFSIFYIFSPILSVILGLFIWLNYASPFPFFSFFWGILFFFLVSSFSVYPLLWGGFFSGSFYSKIGSFRSSIQAVSYEVSMVFLFFGFVFLMLTFSFFDFSSEGTKMYALYMSLPLFFSWVFSCLAETGRSPFDFIEGESELVSGFNTEYFSEMFIFIFLSEYSFILFLSMVTALITGCYLLILKTFFFSFCFIWVRASFPRFRFDMLMMFCWKSILPLSLGGVYYLASFSFLMK
uniref:NADH-ubiquinone oxidoreductase chain 1 n=1 Tax=Hygrobates longiporus TaxID=2740590 RepID=A0A6J4EFM7_9ACAR|nr:NADH dehydrogenase subunit 1 [Hygrobates longiporus]BCG28129.1 NADH dehydrogenase subunit 1 [Hygrobates longiporus]